MSDMMGRRTRDAIHDRESQPASVPGFTWGTPTDIKLVEYAGEILRCDSTTGIRHFDADGGSLVRREAAPPTAPQGAAPARPGSALRREVAAAQPAPQQAAAGGTGAFRSLRERLMQKPAGK